MPIVEEYVKMWPRTVFDIMDGNKLAINQKDGPLTKHGVCILYRGQQPYYIGRALRGTGTLYKRLHSHADKSTDGYFAFWDYFSAFVVENEEHIKEVEGILIAAMPTENRAAPRIKEVQIPKNIRNRLREARRHPFRS